MTNQTGYIVYATDSVGTALGEIEPGAILPFWGKDKILAPDCR